MIKVTVSDTNLKSFTKIRVTFSELTLNHLYYSSQMSTSYDGIEDLLRISRLRLQCGEHTSAATTAASAATSAAPAATSTSTAATSPETDSEKEEGGL
jgi:hypothetical protein